MTQTPGLVSVAEVLDKALSGGFLTLSSADAFRPEHFELDINFSLTRAIRASKAQIQGGLVSMHRPRDSEGGEMIRLGYFQADAIDRPIMVRDFVSRQNKPRLSRLADLDEVIAFIGKFPGVAMGYTVVCANSGIFGEGDETFPKLVGFTYFLDEKKREEGFKVYGLSRVNRTLLPGDLVITKKNSKPVR